MQETVSVIIVSYFTGQTLARSVLSALAQSETKEVILVNNGNPPEDIKRLVDISDDERLKIIESGENIGFSRACNLGAAKASGDYLLILNPDSILDQHTIGAFLMAREKIIETDKDQTAQDHMWMLGAKLINPDGTEQAGARRGTLTPWSAFVEKSRLHKLAPRHPYFRRFNYHQEPLPKKITPIPVISGACMFLPKAAYDEIQGMDAQYFLHVEDIDFCLRFGKAGGAIFFVPHIDILHYKGTSQAASTFVEGHKMNGLIRYFKTHFSDTYPWYFIAFVNLLVRGSFALHYIKSSFKWLASPFSPKKKLAPIQRKQD